MLRRTVLAAIAAALPTIVLAAATEQTVVQTIDIDAPPAKVWSIAGDFVGLPRWYPPAPQARLVYGKNNTVGAIRELTRANGTKVEERLIEYDPVLLTLTYTYGEGMVMSSDYFATVTLFDLGAGRTRVEWRARFKRLAYWTDTPPAGQDDATVRTALERGYKLGLARLKELSEAR